MKKRKNKPTTFEIADLIIKAIVAIAALITAIKWGESPSPLRGAYIVYHIERSFASGRKKLLVHYSLCFAYNISVYRA